jgi:hypothetical protein
MKVMVTRTREAVVEVANLSLDEGVRYGPGGSPSWLPSPVSITVQPAERDAFERDLSQAWRWYEAWTALYLDSLQGRADSWIAALVEYGLRPHEIEIHRATAAAGFSPLTCRLEYMYRHGRRFIAEAQWVSGGLGFFSGIDSLYRHVSPLDGHRHLGALDLKLISTLAAGAAGRGDVFTVVRDDWLSGERFLARRATAAALGVRLLPVDRQECVAALTQPRERSIGLLYGQGYTGLIPDQMLGTLSHKVQNGELWAESPYNYIYRQKWGLALLHDPRFASRFPEGLRTVTPVTILLNAPRPQFELIGASQPAFAPLAEASQLGDVLSLPERLRSDLVVKCGAGVGGLHSNGRGVFRLSGSRGSVQRTLALVEERIKLGEPWIMQPFCSSSLDMPFAAAALPDGYSGRKAHLKVMIFGIRDPSAHLPTIAGGLANYRQHWKVGGRSPGTDSSGNELGAFFTDVIMPAMPGGEEE